MYNKLFIHNIEEYLSVIQRLKQIYHRSEPSLHPSAGDYLFRGLSNSDFLLLPSIYRNSEVTAVDGTNTYITPAYDLELERDILFDFISEASSYIKNLAYNDFLHWAEFARHYGVPTRFLDWTTNPLVALFFACAENETDDGAIWCLNTMEYGIFRVKHKPTGESTKNFNSPVSEVYQELIDNKKSIKYPLLYRPTYIDPRMSAQSSYFMIWSNHFIYTAFEEIIPKGFFIPVKRTELSYQIEINEKKPEFLLKLHISAADKRSFLRNLDMLGINQRSLFPGIEGIGQYINWKYHQCYYDFN